MAAVIYEPTSGALSRTPILCKVEDADTPTLFQVEIKVWRGSLAQPSVFNFTLVKYPDENNSATFDISQLLQGFFDAGDFDIAEGEDFITNTTQVVWVNCTYTITNATSPDEVVNGVTFSVTNGYTEFIEGANAISPVVATSQDEELLVNESAPFFLALTQNSVAVAKIQVVYDLGGSQDLINTFTSLTQSENRLLYSDVSPSRFAGLYSEFYTLSVLDAGDNELAQIKVSVECEPRYEPVTIAFINKNGAWENFTFSKRSDEMIDVESGEFMPYILDTTFGSAPSYNAATPQIKRYDINAKESLKVNTTFLPEEYYETMKQLMMSPECVWYEKGLSVNPKTMNLQKKQHVNKEMVQYTIEFAYASMTQNTVR